MRSVRNIPHSQVFTVYALLLMAMVLLPRPAASFLAARRPRSAGMVRDMVLSSLDISKNPRRFSNQDGVLDPLIICGPSGVGYVH